MRDQGAALSDRAVAVTPPVLCNHPDDVAEVHAQDGFRLHVRFVDRTEGTVYLSDLIHSQEAGVFSALADVTMFGRAAVELGAVTWPNGLDLAPHAMYAALRRDKEWAPR